MLKPHKYQLDAIEFGKKHESVYFALDIGLGKTLIALKLIQHYPRKTLVIAPLKVCYNVWPEEIAKWTPKLTYTILHGPRKNLNLRLKKDVYILNYDGIKWFYNQMVQQRVPMMNLVMDESANLSDPKTKRFKYMKALLPMFKVKIALSATPAPNYLTNLWSQYYILDKGKSLYRTNDQYLKKYFVYDAYSAKYHLAKGAKEKIYNRIAPTTYRLAGKDHLKLPNIIWNNIRLMLPMELRGKYDKLERDFTIDDITAFNAAALSSKLRQFLQGALYTEDRTNFQEYHVDKIEKLKELVTASNGQPVLAAIQFRFEYELIKRVFGYEVPIIYGGTSNHLANRYLQRWNNGDLPLLVVHPGSISEGVNLQAGGHIIVWVALPWSLRHFIQLNGRLYRQGQTKTVTINSITFRSTMDDVVWNVLKQKDATQEDLLAALAERTKRLPRAAVTP